MKKIAYAAAFLSMGLSLQSWAWDNGWEDDNGDNKQSGQYDPVDIQGSKGAREGDLLVASFDSGNTADYARLCDILFMVKAESEDRSVSGTEKYHMNKLLIRANRSFNVDAKFDVADWGTTKFRFIKDSARVLPTCLRYTLPGPVDPVNNPGQRPSQKPHQVCDPEQSPTGCDNTCYGNGTASCAGGASTPGSGSGWDANDQYWQ